MVGAKCLTVVPSVSRKSSLGMTNATFFAFNNFHHLKIQTLHSPLLANKLIVHPIIITRDHKNLLENLGFEEYLSGEGSLNRVGLKLVLSVL